MEEYTCSSSNAQIRSYKSEYQLASMSIMTERNKYFVDLTKEDRNKDKVNYKEDDVEMLK